MKHGQGEVLTSIPDTQEEGLDVLVVDDEPAHAEVVADSLDRIGARSVVVHSEKDAFAAVERQCFDVVVTDLMLEHNDGGIAVLKAVKEASPMTEVIVMTAYSGIETAVEAMRLGAFNYLPKPLDIKQLRTIVEKAGESARLRRVNQEMARRLDEKFGFDGVIGHSPEMLRIIERLRRIAPTDSTVLILGETGTGKELFAQALHQNSNRKKKPFVAFNCAALTESMIESELFGHVKGAFTGATSDRVGKFEFAGGGTVFLDEVGDMPLSTQAKILRVLELGEINRVGSNDVIKVNVRIISATNRNLEEEVAKGNFRLDLYHRLKVITLQIPPLRSRAQDIPILLDHFLRMFAKKDHKTVKGITPAARKILFACDWPGNVRQLKNTAESMVALDIDGVLDIDDLPDEFAALAPPPASSDNTGTEADKGFVPLAPEASATSSDEPGTVMLPLIGRSLDEIERAFIRITLDSTGGNREETASVLGIGERTLYRRIKEMEE